MNTVIVDEPFADVEEMQAMMRRTHFAFMEFTRCEECNC